jgi:uncharacterized protein (UPF0332 family)
MMDVEIIRYRLERSGEMLKDAGTLLDGGSLISAVNRMYYALFYAVVALLKTKGLSSSKHSGVRAMFNQHFVKTGIVRRETGKFYELIFNERQEGDYIDYSEFTLEQVKDYYEKSRVCAEELWSIVNGIIES